MKDHSFKIIALTVVIAHSLLILIFSLNTNTTQNTSKKRMVVKTVNLKLNQVVNKKISNEFIADQNLEVAKTSPLPKIESPQIPKMENKTINKAPLPKKEVKKEILKTTKNATKVLSKEKVNVKQEKETKVISQKVDNSKQEQDNKLLALAKEKISKINSSSVNISTNHKNVVPSSLTPIQFKSDFIDSTSNATEVAYQDELALRLKTFLQLPEHGNVKIKLILNRQGKVIKLEVLDHQSQRNSEYISKQLPKLDFPNFKDNFGTDLNHEFIITLSNK